MKINKAKLAAAIQARIDEYEAKYEAEMTEYIASFDAVRSEIVAALKDATKSVQSAKEFAHLGFLTNGDHYCTNPSVRLLNVHLPRRPEKPHQLEYAQRALRQVEMCAEDTINVRERDNFTEYI